jgi:hypothetical protein
LEWVESALTILITEEFADAEDHVEKTLAYIIEVRTITTEE